jgi:hypothetical protein
MLQPPRKNRTFLGCVGAGLALVAASLAGCGSGNGAGSGGGSGGTGGGAGQPVTSLSAPVPMNLYPVDGTSSNPARLFIFVTAVGSNTVKMPLAFDTGSAGITLNALPIFPSSMVGSSGFIFAGGESSISYNGITVTQLQGTRSYGGPSGHTEIGNLGFATLTFGDAKGLMTTQMMPVFLYYAIQSNANPPQPVPAETQDGWFGVNDAPNLIKLSSGTSNAPACTQTVTGSCWVGSVFKYLQFAAGVDAGFTVSPLKVQTCDISSGNCVPSGALTVGLDSSSASGFTLTGLPCPPSGYTGPSQINGYPVCQEYVPGTAITMSGSSTETFTTPVLFDTGTPYFVLNVPAAAMLPASISSFQTTTPGGFVYTAEAGTDLFAVHVQQASGTTSGSVMGLGYFQTNSLLTDFTTGLQGWK